MKKRLLSIVLTLALCLSLLPTAALAESSPATTSVVAGAFTLTVPADADGNDYYSYENNVLTIKDGAVLTIANTDPNTETSDRVEVEKDADATITLAGVKIDVSDSGYYAALKIGYESSGNVTVVLAEDSENYLKSGGNCAGLQKDGGTGKLTITGTGSLYAIGGDGIDGNSGGAGIGGSYYDSGQNIEIAGGTVTAIGGARSAGIGGGADYGLGKNITISGGTVTATGGEDAAGIGGAGRGAINITISGGTVTANGGISGAGIGGGSSGTGSTITISDGTVIANGGEDAPGIGGGGFTGNGKNIVISGGNVTATGSNSGAGIGGGWNGDASDITISGGSVTATGGNEGGAGIGGGSGGKASNITISSGTVTATGGSEGGAGIGGGKNDSASGIAISGGTVTATATGGTGISGDVTVSGGDVIATGNEGGTGINGSLTLADGSTHVIIEGDTKAVGSATTDTSASGYFRSGTPKSNGDFISVQSGGVIMISNDDTDAYFEYVSDSHLAYTNTDGLTHDLVCNDSCSVTKVTVISEEVHDYDATTKRCVCGATKTKIEFSGGITANKSEYFYGDIIQLTVKPVSAGSNTFVSGLDLTLWLGDIQLDVTGKVTEDPESQEYIITYDTSNKGIPVGTDATTLTVKFAETDGMQACEGSVSIILNPKVLTVSVTATDRTYEPGNTTVAVTANLSGKVDSDSVALNPANPTGTIPSADAGEYTVTLPTFTLSGDDMQWYTLTQPTGVTVTITKANATDAMKTASGWLAKNGTSTVQMPALPSNASHGELEFTAPITSAEVNSGVLTIQGGNGVDVTTPGTYTVTVPVVGGDDCNYKNYDITVTLTGTDKKVPVLTAEDFTKTYDGNPVTVDDLDLTSDVVGTWSWNSSPIDVADSGSYTLTFRPNDDQTYVEAEIMVSVTINRRALTLTANNKTVKVGGSESAYDYTAAGLATGDSITTPPTLACSPNMAVTGSYPITIDVSGVVIQNGSGADVSSNYEITGTNGTLTVGSSGGGYTPPSSSDDGDYTPSTPSTENVTVPISGDDNTIHVDASVSGDKATVDHVDLNKLDTVIGDHVDTGTVTIDFSGLDSSKPITTVEIPSNVVKEIAAAVSDPNNDAHSFEVILSDGTSIEFDAVALGEKAAQADGLDITISIEHHENAELTNAQKNAVGDRVAYDINVTSGGKHISGMGGKITVHAPYELKPGEKARGIVVWYVDDAGNRERCETSYDPIKQRVNWKTDHLSLYMIDYCPSAVFTDLDIGAWYHEATDYVIENGMMAGYGETFGPNDSITRGQIVTILHRLEGAPIVNYLITYKDVDQEKYYAEAIRWATSEGIVAGYGNGSFGPDDPITRQQLATILWRYSQHKGYDVSVGEDTNILSYEDAFHISEYAIPAMQWACGAGVMGGYGNGYLGPNDGATRAQAAQMLKNFMEKTAK